MFHAVGSHAYGDSRRLFTLSTEQFEKNIKLLVAFGEINVVSLDETAIADDRRNIAITFDDGYKDNLEIAAPLLGDLGLPFTVFVTTEFVRKSKAGFLAPADLRALVSIPQVKIGSHGASHLDLTTCDDSILIKELRGSKDYLEDTIGQSIDTLSYPYGKVNERVRQTAISIGYKLGACSRGGLNNSTVDRMLLRRTEISSIDNEKIFMQKLRGNWDWLGRWSNR
jgi:peptidoglycan/xylan/chitin deacetylase (PgdA/CDA1 family)